MTTHAPRIPRRSRSLSLRPDRRDHLHGFSLVELLISVLVGVALVSSVSYVITSQIRGTQDTERSQRTRDDASRLNYLIQTEASEAVELVDPSDATQASQMVVAGCSAYANGDPSPNGTTALFVLKIPLPSGDIDARIADNIPASARIYYYARKGGLDRCGPAIQRNGSLNLTVSNGAVALQPGVVSANATFQRVTCNGVSSTGREVGYQLQFNDVPGGYRPPCAIARAKAFRVCDPGSPSECEI